LLLQWVVGALCVPLPRSHSHQWARSAEIGRHNSVGFSGLGTKRVVVLSFFLALRGQSKFYAEVIKGSVLFAFCSVASLFGRCFWLGVFGQTQAAVGRRSGATIPNVVGSRASHPTNHGYRCTLFTILAPRGNSRRMILKDRGAMVEIHSRHARQIRKA